MNKTYSDGSVLDESMALRKGAAGDVDSAQGARTVFASQYKSIMTFIA